MVLALEIALIFILLVCLVNGIKYILLLLVKDNADKAFKNLYEHLPHYYETINALFAGIRFLPQELDGLVEDTKKMISLASGFDAQKDGNERIIAYANSILENTDIIIKSAAEGGAANVNIQKYNNLLNDFNNIKDNYNKSAQKLRHYADVFPTSFYARLKEIKIMDYLN